jgi:beta-glucanase (GH16 family)
MHKSLSKAVITGGLLLLAHWSALASPIYADGDLAPLGDPDGIINLADYLVANHIVLEQSTAGELELAHGDLYPPGAPDGIINLQDLLLLQQRVLSQSGSNYVQNLDLFADGPATASVSVGGVSSSTVLVVGSFTAPGATVINNPNFTDPDVGSNTVWYVAVSGGVANTYIGTGNLSSDPVLDSGFDFSGAGDGYLVFDIKVKAIDPDATLTVKMDSGYPKLGQAVLTPARYSVGNWQRVAISFAELLADPGPGPGLDLANVGNAFVIEVTGGAAEFYLDNIFVSHACPEPGACNATVNSKDEPANYSLVWSDEFDGSTLSSDNWGIETGYGGGFGWGNNEWQLYTNSPDNVSVQGGNLVLSARCASPPACGIRNGSITSARINTLNKFTFKYGRVEARIKPPVGTGAWPAFWMLGSNFPVVGWPHSGEIDIVEMHNLYSDDKTTHFTMHYCDDAISSNPCEYNPGWQYVSQFKTFPYSLGDDFHVFSADWDANGVTGKIDDIPYFYLAIAPGRMDEFLEEFFMILNVAIGGTLGGAPDASTPWPQTMLVDYVRVYQDVGGDGTNTIGPPPPSPELGVYTESHTQNLLSSSIINGADFGGNVVIINTSSTNVAPFDGNVVLQVDYTNTGRSYGGFLFDFGSGRDLSGYQTLKFSIDKSAISNMAKLNIEVENPGQQKFAAKLDDYTPVVSGNWATYEIPLADFSGADLTNIVYLGFWTPRTAGGLRTFGTLYFDDIHFAGGP